MLRPEIELYDFQKVGKKFIETRKYVLIGDSMGLGKTLQSISTMEHGERMLVICPAMLRTNWLNEIEKFTKLKAKIADAKFDWSDVPDVVISSYANVKNIPFDFYADHITLDECHYIKNIQSQRTKAVHKLVKHFNPNYLIGLSGTPITTSVVEFYSILKLLSLEPDKANGLPLAIKSQYGFNMRFSNQSTRSITVSTRSGTRNVQVQQFSGIKNKEELKEYLKGKYLRRLASKVLDLPPIVDKELIVSNKKAKSDAKLYDAFEQGGEMSEHISTLKIESANNKVPFTLKYLIEIIDGGEQCVVFSDHIEPIKNICEGLTGEGISNGMVCGVKSKQDRDRAIEDFKAGKLKVLVCSFSAAAVGLTLTSSRHLVFNDLSWRPDMVEQARKRIHRISQERSCVITSILNGDFDKRIKRKLDAKIKDISQIVTQDK